MKHHTARFGHKSPRFGTRMHHGYIMENCIKDICSWMHHNKLVVPKSAHQPVCNIYTDQCMSTTDQTTYVSRMMFRNIHFVRKLKGHLDFNSCTRVMQSLVISRLDRNYSVLINSPDTVVSNVRRHAHIYGNMSILAQYKQGCYTGCQYSNA